MDWILPSLTIFASRNQLSEQFCKSDAPEKLPASENRSGKKEDRQQAQKINDMLSKGENTVFGIRRPRTSSTGHVNRCAFHQLSNEVIYINGKTAVKIVKMGTEARHGNGHLSNKLKHLFMWEALQIGNCLLHVVLPFFS